MPQATANRPARVIAVTSGKGGVGKTNASANLAIALAARGKRVCVFDADTGMANINVLLGFTPLYTLEHLLAGERRLDEVLIQGPGGIHIVPAASGVADCAELTEAAQTQLTAALRELESRFDYLLVDTAAGAGNTVLSFIRAAHYAVVVFTPEPTSLTNAFSLLKIMKNRGIRRPTYLLANQVNDPAAGLELYRRIQIASRHYLRFNPAYLGHILADEAVPKAVRLQRPVIQLRHDAPASRCYYALAEAVDRHLSGGPDIGIFSTFWDLLGRQGREEGKREEKAAATASPLERLEAQLAAPELTEAQARSLLTPLLQQFNERFGDYPVDARRALFQNLERNGYPGDEIRYLVLTLEELFERNQHRSLHDPEHLVARLLAANGGDEARLRQLAAHLEQACGERFTTPLFPPPEERLLTAIESDEMDEQDARETIQLLQLAFEERFGRPVDEERSGDNIHHIDDQRVG